MTDKSARRAHNQDWLAADFGPPARWRWVAYQLLKNVFARCRGSVHCYDRAASTTGQSGSPAPEPAFVANAPLAARSRKFPCRRARRVGRRARCVPQVVRRASGRYRDGLHPDPASRSDPCQHDGRSAGRPYDDQGPAGRRRDADRAGTCLHHSAGRLSLDPRRRIASLGAARAPRRAPAVRLLPAFVGGKNSASARSA